MASATRTVSENDWRNGVDSPHGQLHRKDPQVVGDREEGLTAPTLQTKRCLNWPCARDPAQACNTNARCARGEKPKANGVWTAGAGSRLIEAYAASGTTRAQLRARDELGAGRRLRVLMSSETPASRSRQSLVVADEPNGDTQVPVRASVPSASRVVGG